jgi:hypothetical protein
VVTRLLVHTLELSLPWKAGGLLALLTVQLSNDLGRPRRESLEGDRALRPTKSPD